MIEARLSHYGSEEVEEVSEALIQLCQYMQLCNEIGTSQQDSLSGDGILTGTARCDRRRSTSVIPLPTVHEPEVKNLESVSKVETRSKRNNRIRVLTNTSTMIVGGGVQPCKENISYATRRHQLLVEAHLKPPVVPAVVLSAMQSLEFQQRLQKEAAGY